MVKEELKKKVTEMVLDTIKSENHSHSYYQEIDRYRGITTNIVDMAIEAMIELGESHSMPLTYHKFLFVEDGSVDVAELENIVDEDIKIVVYRKGGNMPRLMDTKDKILV